MNPLRTPLIRFSALAMAFAGFLAAAPAEAKDKHDKHDKHSDHDNRKWGRDWDRRHDHDRNHGHRRIEVRSCDSHRHHHSHIWHSYRSHRDFKCLGHR